MVLQIQSAMNWLARVFKLTSAELWFWIHQSGGCLFGRVSIVVEAEFKAASKESLQEVQTRVNFC